MLPITNVSDYKELAKHKLPRMVYDYYASGAEDQWTLRENMEAFSRIQRTCLCKGCSCCRNYNGLIDNNTFMYNTLSSWSSYSIEEVNMTGPGIRFFQISVFRDRNLVQKLIERAENAGYKAIVNGSALAAYYASQVDRSLSWKDIKWLKEITSLSILVKGILTADDTRVAIECGVAGIIVSNHGGRRLDCVPATINCLEEVVREAKCRIPVFLDGGIRFKALALGASGIFIGRPVLFSLAVDGEAGLRNALQMLRDELEVVMALSGCASLKKITRDHVTTESDRIRRSRL
ncbi:hypothetical protein PR202_ga19005 [Eleusine coracana subsp. coracana]|uniref:FMN hydroxy acid dehydrogenase domain-containing protein n=1 Tax=Eleusine coracana subsp. coracana TaxID=191504 RepID=A0AAV5CUZ5_ELECO|nr:hypothetical protein PR202_ga19005 [Eleusine coracana subsp. coracana]